MRGFTRTLVVLILFSSILTVGESGRSLFNKGVKAEARQDYEAAYEFYKAAYAKNPSDLKYRVPYERTRFLAASVKVRKGQRLRDQGKLQEALDLFQKATEIDPSNELANQEIRRTQQMMKGQPAGEIKPPPPPPEDPLRKRLAEAASSVTLSEMSNVPLAALKINNETKVIYETIGKIAGINVLFDPDYQSRKLSLELNGGITFQEALDIVALESRTFWRPVTPNTIFVAADTPTKRRELEQSVIKTFYLGNVSTPTDLQDVVNAIRTILEVQRIQQIPSQNAIVVRGTPDQMALAQKMIDDIDKAKPEVVVDVIVAQVRRDKVRDIGILPPQNATVALQGATTPATPATGGGTTPATTSGTLNFNDLQHLNSTNYAVSIDPLHARALFTDDATRIIQNPQIRAGDGMKATLKIGDRIPIATGSFGTPLGVGTGVGVGLGVNTQFQYLEVGVNIDITSKVHPGNEISMKVLLEISSQSGTANIGGITQPIISQRKIEHEIRLKDGEMNLLGGILEESELKSISGTPILGQIPLLGRLFSQEKKEKINNEIVFLLVPHVVRGQELSELNHRSFDVGTATGIGLRMNPKPAPRPENNPGQPPISPQSGQATPAPGTPMLTTQTSVQPGQPQQASAQPSVQPSVQPAPLGGQSQQQVTPVNPQQLPPASGQPSPPPAIQQNPGSQPATPASGPVTLQLLPGNLTPVQGTSFAVNVALAGGQDIFAVPVQITYDPQLLQFLTVSNGEFLTKDGQPVALVHRDDAASGTLILTAQRPPGAAGVSGDGTVFSLVFRAKAKGSGVIAITVPGARNSQNQPIQAMGSQASVTVN